MLYIDVGNTLRGGLRTGIQRVVRSLAYELASGGPSATRLVAFDLSEERYFALSDPELIRVRRHHGEHRRARTAPISTSTPSPPAMFSSSPIPPGPSRSTGAPCSGCSRRKGVVIVVLQYDAIPVLLPDVCHPDTLVSFAEIIADHLQYADYALTTSAGVDRDLEGSPGASSAARSPRASFALGADFEAHGRAASP